MLDRQHRQEKPKPAADALLAWYDRARRDLPWRAAPDQHADPYRVWLSEIMLQQTTVAAVKPYFATFTSRWPTVEALAAAEPDAVLGAWAGLGYYARARNLIACAAKIAQEHGGRFPDTEADLLTLPGIGAYTAAAITAIAFGHRSVVVDGNVERVVARYCAITEPLPGAKGAIRTAADHLTPDLRPGDYAQAMMDLGATVCTPRAPACGRCPLSAGCAARKQGIAADLPRKAAKSGRPIRRGAAFVLRDGEGRLLVRRRPAKGLLGGMLEVPGTDWIADMPLPTGPIAAPLSAQWREAGSITHVFTHFTLELRVFAAKVPSGTIPPAGTAWLETADIETAALPNVMRKAVVRAGAG